MRKWLFGLTLGAVLLSAPVAYADTETGTEITTDTGQTIEIPMQTEETAAYTTPEPVQIMYGYEFEDGSFDIWYIFSGIAVNEHTVVSADYKVPEINVNLLSEARPGYEAMGIDIRTIDPVLRLYDGATMNQVSILSEDTVTIFHTEASLTPSVMSYEDPAPGDITSVYGAGSMYIRADFTNATEYAQKTDWIKKPADLAADQGGLKVSIDGIQPVAVMGKDGSIVGLATESKSLIPASMIKKALEDVGEMYQTAGQIAALDFTELTKATQITVNTEEYTEDSVAALNAAIEQGKNLLNKKDITQKEIDDAKTKIDEAKNGLVLVEKTNYISIIIGIVFGVIMLAFFAYVIHRFLRDPMFKQNIIQHGLLKALFMKSNQPAKKKVKSKKPAPQKQVDHIAEEQRKYQNQIRQENQIYTKAAPVQQNPMQTPPVQPTPAQPYPVQNIPNTPAQQTPEPVYQGEVEQNTRVRRIASSSTNETTVLTPEKQPMRIFRNQTAWLVRNNTGECVEVIISGKSFTIGTAPDADYMVSNNDAISRIHCMIACMGTEYVLFDNGSTNGTYVNSYKMTPMVPFPIHDGSKIVMANEMFEFKIRG